MRRRKKVMKVGNVLVKSVEQIEGIRESGKINTAVLDYVEAHIQAGFPQKRSIAGFMRKL